MILAARSDPRAIVLNWRLGLRPVQNCLIADKNCLSVKRVRGYTRAKLASKGVPEAGRGTGRHGDMETGRRGDREKGDREVGSVRLRRLGRLPCGKALPFRYAQYDRGYASEPEA